MNKTKLKQIITHKHTIGGGILFSMLILVTIYSSTFYPNPNKTEAQTTNPSSYQIDFNTRPYTLFNSQTSATNPAFHIAANGNIGVGTSNPSSKLTVNGLIESTAGGVEFPDGSVQSTSAEVKVYTKINDAAAIVSTTTKIRYHIEATKAKVRNTVPLDMNIVNSLCKTDSGCYVTVGMRNWTSAAYPGLTASLGPYKLFLSKTSNWWRVSDTDTAGLDNNNTATNIISAFNDCLFTDGNYLNGAAADNTVGFGLLNWNSTYNDANMVCTLDIEN
jgi:hypothetical protein